MRHLGTFVTTVAVCALGAAARPPAGGVLAVGVDAGPDRGACAGETVTLTASASGDDGPFAYAWDRGLGTGQSHDVVADETRAYVVTVTDAAGATASDTVVVVVDERAPVFDFLPADVAYACGEAPPPPAALTISDAFDPSPALAFREEPAGEVAAVAYFDDGAGVRYVPEVNEDPGLRYGAPVERLRVTAMCTLDSARERRWRVRNPNPFPVYAEYEVLGGVDAGGLVVPAGVDLYFFTGLEGNPLIVTWLDETAGEQRDIKAGNLSTCANPEYENCASASLRIWDATDRCGNARSFVQRVFRIDTVAPRFAAGLGDTLRVAPDAVPPATAPVATDACDPEVTVTLAEQRVAGSCPQDYVLRRRWRATDACGNRDSVLQVIVVRDAVAPVIRGLDADVTRACGPEATPLTPAVADAHDPDPTWALRVDTVPGDCPAAYALVYRVEATDACGNAAAAEARLTVADDAPPVFADVPADVTLPAAAELPRANPTATDACSPPVSVTALPDSTAVDPASGAAEVFRSWLAVDACGNGARARQRIRFAADGDTVPAERPALRVLTGFSPNGDGRNDAFTVEHVEAYPGTAVRVYNRWGLRVFAADDYDNSWRGTYGAKDLPDGTYYYVLDPADGDPRRAGFVQLHR